MASLKDHLTEVLVNSKLLSPEQLSQALDLQREKGGRLSEIIISLGLAKEKDLIAALSQGLGFPLIDLKRIKIDYEIAKLIPVDVARKNQVVAISKMGDSISVAMVDPLDIFAIDQIQSLTGYKINPIISSSEDISQAIEMTYPDSTSGLIDDLMREMSVSSLELIKEERTGTPSDKELVVMSRQAPVVQLTNMILQEAVYKKASDVLIEPFDKSLRVRFRIDGVLIEQKAPPKSVHPSIVSRIKVISGLNIAEHRLPQDGRFKIQLQDKEIDFRVSILPSSCGEKVAVRILDKFQASLNLEKLGFCQENIEKIKKVSKLPHGMMLVCGPTGSGKTTTLYSILKFVDSPEKNIVTVEDPVEYQLEGINQVTAKPDIGLSFALALRSILRQDPNVIMIGEIRDFETVDIAIKSALTGHFVLSTLHTTTASGSIARLMNMGVEPYLLTSSLVCVMAQRLVRKVCAYCKEKQPVKKEIMDSLKISLAKSENPEFFRGRGCPSCFNTGYAGRVGIAEVLVLTSKIRELILSRSQEHLIKLQARKEGMKTLREDGLEAALKGMTSLEEILRVTAPDE